MNATLARGPVDSTSLDAAVVCGAQEHWARRRRPPQVHIYEHCDRLRRVYLQQSARCSAARCGVPGAMAVASLRASGQRFSSCRL